ncbi:MAG: metal ABC transporter permease [Dehalococcoidia bacterium]|nr:metal ABC transporter permease [Dehalococcoidia bacterium]MDW8008636.1 metal ABC transporter permease [Chloroflexota bacterium]
MLTILDPLWEPWTLEFMQRALAAACLASVVAAVVGCYVVLRGMAFLGDAIPHATFSGVAAAFLLGGNLYVGGTLAALATALLIGLLGRRGVLKHDTAVGTVFVAAFALGVLLASRRSTYTVDLFAFVFGNVLAVGWEDVWLMAAVGGLVLALVFLFWKELLIVSYDPTMASALGVPVELAQMGMLALVALTTVIALKAVGIVLVVALLVTPAATGQLLARSLAGMMAVAVVAGLVSSLTGLYVAYYADVSPSAAIVLVATGIFALAFLLRRLRAAARRALPEAAPSGPPS